MANIRRRTAAGFNSSEKRVDILSGRMEMYRPVVKIDESVDHKTVEDGMWLEDTATGLKFMADNTVAKVARFILEFGEQGYIGASKEHFGNAHISVGFGIFRAAVGADYYVADTYAIGDELTVDPDGKTRKAASGELVVAIAVEEDQNNQLRFDTVHPQYKMA